MVLSSCGQWFEYIPIETIYISKKIREKNLDIDKDSAVCDVCACVLHTLFLFFSFIRIL